MFIRKEFDRVSPESAGIRSEDIDWYLDRLESGYTEPHGLMILKHGKVAAEGWWSPYAAGIRHGLQSHSKTYAATAVGLAYTEGLVKLDERLIDIFPEEAPEEPSENMKKLTVRDVLCMGCGMESMPAPTENWIRDFLAIPVEHEPGTAFMYNSVGSSILAAIVVKKSGMSMHEYMKTRLYDKIGIYADNHKWMHMPDGIEVGGGGLYATLEDNVRLMKLYLDGGEAYGERILAEDYVKLATTLQNESATERAVNPPAEDNFVGYGFQIWMCRPEGVYRADGAMGQFTIVIPEEDMVIGIMETAVGAVAAQTTLDITWEFLNRIRENRAAGENREAAQKLQNRLERLSLPRAPYQPFSPLIPDIDGQRYKVTGGELYLAESGINRALAGAQAKGRIDEFSFEFRPDHILMHFTADTGAHTLRIASDGSRWSSVIPGQLADTALLSASFVSDNVLEIRLRMIETCNELIKHFIFENDKVTCVNAGEPNLMRGRGTPCEAVKI